MNIIPKSMAEKILEHLDRLPTYAEVRDKVISLSQMQNGDTTIQQMETSTTTGGGQQWQTMEYDEESGRSWQWMDTAPAGPNLPELDSSYWEEDINAVNGACFNCGGMGHMSRDCPRRKRRKCRRGAKGEAKAAKAVKDVQLILLSLNQL